MESSEETVVEGEVSEVCEISQQSLPSEDHCQLAENSLPTNPNDTVDPPNIVDQNSDSGNPISVETTNIISQDANVPTETSTAISTDTSTSTLPPLPKDDKEQPPAQYSADYNMQNYANYNYMYNYNNYYGYPYPQYQWDYNSQQYYQPYQNYYNYNYNANQAQTASSKPPPPPPDAAVQLPVEEKPTKTNVSTVDDSNRYSPTAETDDDDTMKGWSENNKSDGLIEQTTPVTPALTDSVPLQTMPSEQIEIQQKMIENNENKAVQPIVPTITQMQPQLIVPMVAQLQPYTIPVQQPNYLINPQVVQQIQPTESTTNELMNQQQNVPAQNGKEDSIDKLSKVSSVLGKNQAKKRLMAFSMMKQKLQEQNNSSNDYQNLDAGEGNDVEFVPELNVFQTVTKKKVVTNKKVTKVIKAQQTIEQIEEMKKDELLQGNNAALYQQLLRNGGNEAPILQKLGIESLAEKYSAKIREQDKRLQRHHHRRRDNVRRGHKYRRHSHSKSRSRSRSRSAEKPKMRALEVKSWKDFTNGGFQFDKFRRFKMDEVEEIKGKERKSRMKKRHGISRSDGKNQNSESTIATETEKENNDKKFRFNILERKKEIMKSFEVISLDGECTKDFPSSIIQHTKTKPYLKYSANPSQATCHLQNRQQMFATLLPEIEAIVIKFLSSIKPKKLKENLTLDNSYSIDDKLLAMMKDKNIYPFKGWWPKTCFIITQVKEDPNVEIDNDALIVTASKRTKKSRFNDDTSLVDLRPTVPSKWDSDYDGSPVTDKVSEVNEVPQNMDINTNDHVSMIVREEDNPLDISHQEETMDTKSDVGVDNIKIDINVNQVIPILSHESQNVSKLNTEYVEFLKIVSAEHVDENVNNGISNTNVTNEIFNTSEVEMENEINLSIKSHSFKGESVQNDSVHNDSVLGDSVKNESEEDTSNKSSDESVSLQNVTQRPIDISFVENVSSNDKKFKKKKKSLHKKSKKMKKKGNKKKKKSKSSTSESSQDSESQSDSSSEDSETDTSNSSSTVEEKKKRKKSKDKKKKRDKSNIKKKHKSDKNKIKKSEHEKDGNSSILNLLEKAFNVEIKKRPLSDSEETKQKKKKRKHNRKEDQSNENSEDKLDIVKERLKETFTKLAKTDKDQSCDENTVNEVLKYLKMDKEKEKKNKKSKKSSKRKYDSDISEHSKISKKSKLDNSLKYDKIDKKKKSSKKKKSIGNNSVSKKKTKKKKLTDSSETEDGDESKHDKTHNDEIENFFGQRPNEWNMNKSSMRGVVNHPDTKTNDKLSKIDQFDENAKISSETLCLIDEVCHSDMRINDTPSKKCQLEEISQIQSETLCLGDDNSYSSQGYKIKKGKISKKSDKNDICKKLLSIDVFEEGSKQENYTDKALETSNGNNFSDNISKNIIAEISKTNVEKAELDDQVNKVSNFISNQYDKNVLTPGDDDELQTMLVLKNNEQKDQNKDINYSIKPTINKSINTIDKPPTKIIKPLISSGGSMSYRDKVKMNLKKLSSCDDNIPFIFGLTSPLNLMKSKQLEFEEIKKSFKTFQEEDDSKLLKLVDRPKVISEQIESQKLIENKMVSPKLDMEINKESADQNLNEVDSDTSFNRLSSTTSANIENLNSARENEQNKSSLFINDSLDSNDEYSQCENETSSSDGETKNQENTLDTIESSSNSYKENKGESYTEFENCIVGQDITTSSHLSDSIESEQNFEQSSNSVKFHERFNVLSNTDSKLVPIAPSLEMNNYSDCIQNSSINLEYPHIDNELITQWMSDWSKIGINAAVEANNSNNLDNSTIELQRRKKSRWDEPPNFKQEENNKPMSSSCTTKDISFENISSNIDDYYVEEQNIESQTPLMNCNVDDTGYDYSESWSNEYADNSEPYYEYCPPQYSEIQTVDYNQSNIVDYNTYENIDTSYDFHNKNDEMWKSIDTVVQPVIDEISAIQQVGDVLEMSSNNIPNSETEFSIHGEELNENIETIIPIKEELVEDEKSKSLSESPCSNDQFLKLFQQHVEHYNQNPIKYSLREPVLDHVAEINVNIPEKSPVQENSDSNNQEENDIPIPLRERAYSLLIEDDNTNIFITSDNYLAYCAIEDKCMVHIAVHTSNLNGIDDEVRHCFNINQNGVTVEYWLHANLIPFSNPSDNESGVFSNEEEATAGSDSCQEDNDVNDNGSNDDIIEGEWEMVENNEDYWLNIHEKNDNARVFKKYGNTNRVDQTEIIPEANLSSSSDEDSYESDFSDSYTETCSTEHTNIAASSILESLIAKSNQNTSYPIAVDTTAKEQPTEKVATCSVVTPKKEHDETGTPIDQSMLSIEFEKNNSNEIIKKENFIPKIKSEYNENISIESEKKEDNAQELGVLSNNQITIEDLSRMNTIMKQQIFIQRLKMCSKERIQEKVPDTELVQYSDNMEVVKHPFLGLFQPPTFSILSKAGNGDKMDASKLSKRVTFADGVHPGESETVFPTHNEVVSRPMSPPPLKKLMRETLKLKRHMYPLKRSKMRIKLKMLKKKVAKVIPLVKDPTSSSVVEYYIRRRRLADLPTAVTANHAVEPDNLRNNHNNYDRSRIHNRSTLRQQRTTRELTPVPSDNDGWNDNII